MANRFWVLSGGTGTWDGTATGKWSTTSGGTAGAAVPTAADDVFFDTHSGTGTITLGATSVCRSLTTTGYTGTFAGSSDLNIGTTTAGSLTIGTGTTWTYTGTMNFVGTSTNNVTTNGKSIETIGIFGSGASLTLQDNLTCDNLNVLGGTFFTNGKTVSAVVISVIGTDTKNRTLNLGSSAVNAANFLIDQSSGGTSTISPGTSTVTMNTDGGAIGTEDGTAFNLNNLVFASTTNTSSGLQVLSFSGPLNITVAGSLTMTGYVTMDDVDSSLSAINLTGNLILGGSPALNIISASGSQIPFNVSGTITPGTCTLADINATGSGTHWNFASSLAMMTDGGNNSGITFPVPGNIGTAVGTSTVSATGRAHKTSTGTAAGAATVSGTGKSIKSSVGTSLGSVIVSGIAKIRSLATGTALGAAAVSGVGKKRVSGIGTAAGIASAIALSPVKVFTVATAIGTCDIQGIGNISPQPSPQKPTENAINVLSPTEDAISVLNPIEYAENIKNPLEYPA